MSPCCFATSAASPRESERSAGDLFGLLARVSQALGVMTHHILEQGGVVGDFHGDAAMGFWGWPHRRSPTPSSGPAAPRSAFARRLSLASGDDQSSRLQRRRRLPRRHRHRQRPRRGRQDRHDRPGEGHRLRPGRQSRLAAGNHDAAASGLHPDRSAHRCRHSRQRAGDRSAASAAWPACGPSACPRPSKSASFCPPLPNARRCTDEHLAAYESALAAFETRDWPLALTLLHAVPPHDLAKDFLTLFIAQHARTPPPNWDGSIPMAAK